MDQNGILYQSLRDEIDKLEKRCSKLESDLSRTLAIYNRHADWCVKEFKAGYQEHDDSLVRIHNLEGKVFPTMAINMEHLRRTIGDSGMPYENPLDRKKD
jgi:hypothetical protein